MKRTIMEQASPSCFYRDGILRTPFILNLNAIHKQIQPENLTSMINTLLLKKFQKKFEGKCTDQGWIKPGASLLIKRSIGKVEPEYFNNFIKINCEFKVSYCCPQREQKLEVTIDSINNLGIKCIQGPLYIILPKQHHIEKNLFEDLREGDKVRITIQCTRIRLFESHIDIIATLDEKIDIKTISSKNDDIEELSDIDDDDEEQEGGIF